MSELVIEATAEAASDFEAFRSEHSSHVHIETGHGDDGLTIVNLVIERFPEIIQSLAVLVAVLKGKGVEIRAMQDGKSVNIDELAAKPSK